MSEHTWEETKKILDDPFVSADTKERVLASYQMAGAGDDNGAAEQYANQYNMDGDYAEAMFGVDPNDAYEQARQESESAGYQDRQVRDRLGENQSELDNARTPGSGSGGITTSDELFDLAEPALEVFEQFLPIDAQAPGDCRHIDSPLNLESDVQKLFDEQRGIDFQKFLDEAQRLRDAHSVLKETHSTTESSLNSLYKDWTGAGANASYQKYSEDIAPNVQELLEYLEGGAQVIETAVDTVFQLCKNKADEIMGLYSPTVGSAVPDTATKVMKLARGEFDSQDEILEVAAWVDAECGSNLESTIRADGGCGLNDENKQYTIEQCKKWVRDSWNPDLYDNLYARFKSVCEDTKEQVDQAWEQVNTYLKDYKSEFPEGAETPQPQPQPQPQPDQGGPGTPGGPGPGGGTGGGGTGGGGGAPSMPEAPTPEAEKPPEPGKNPVTGEDLEVDPETGEPYPIDPETGEAIKDVGDDQDTVTVEKGDHRLEMTEPDAEGQMDISVDDGSGQPKDYKLDFGTGEEGAQASEGGTGAEGQPGDGRGGEFGPQGSGDEATGDEKVYRPGPDGKIHIEDGNLKITAEQPEGPDGPTKVTVDDGNPPPTTYTLGESTQDGAAGGAQGPGGVGGGSPRENIRTMPAYGEDPFAGEGGDDNSGDPAGGGPPEGAGRSSGLPGTGAPAAAVPAGVGAEAPGLGGAGGTDAQAAAAGAGGLDTGGGGAGAAATPGVGAGSEEETLGAGAQSGAQEQSTPANAGAGLAAAPGGMGEAMAAPAAQSGASAGGAGGMGMMGGMGAMGGGAGGGQGGDQERGANPYRLDGGIFGNSGGGQRISGSLHDDGDRSVRFDR